MGKAVNTTATLAKWKSRSANAGQALKDGVGAVTQAPTQKAAQAVGKYAAGVARAVNDGTFVDGCNKVTLQDWKDAMTGKGVTNYGTGVNNISPRAAKNMADQQQAAAQISDMIASMPNETENDAEQRMLAAVRAMRQFRKS